MFMNVLLDIILVGILLAGAVAGLKNGFVDTIAKPVKFVLAIVLAFALGNTVGEFLVEPLIGPAISHKFSSILIEKYSEMTVDTVERDLPTLVKVAASICGVDVHGIASAADGASVIESVANAVTDPVVDVISLIFGFVIAYFVSKIILKFLLIFINTVVNNGIAGKLNKTLGCIVSVFLAFVVGWAFTSVCEFLFNIPAIASVDGVNSFTGGAVYKFFRTFTPLDLLLSF
jgi:uncharacterized membrane protein required for colicin V production